jgi:hypothetical protein
VGRHRSALLALGSASGTRSMIEKKCRLCGRTSCQLEVHGREGDKTDSGANATRPGLSEIGQTDPGSVKHELGEGADCDVLCHADYGVHPLIEECVDSSTTAQFAMALLQKPIDAPRIVSQHGEQTRYTRNDLPILHDLPGRITNSSLGKLKAKNLVTFALQPSAPLRSRPPETSPISPLSPAAPSNAPVVRPTRC